MQVSPQAMSQIIRFLYTGAIQEQIINMAALKQVPFAISTKSQKYFLFLIFSSMSQKPCFVVAGSRVPGTVLLVSLPHQHHQQGPISQHTAGAILPLGNHDVYCKGQMKGQRNNPS